jgi:chromosome segregation ATPase
VFPHSNLAAGEEANAEIRRLHSALERAEQELQQHHQHATDAITRIEHLESMLHDEQQRRVAAETQVAENAELLDKYQTDADNYLVKLQEGAVYVQVLY